MGRRDGGVVHQAEAHRAGRLGVVAGRPAEAERGPDVAGQHGVDRRGRRRPTRRPRRRSSARSRPCRGRSALLRARRARGCPPGIRGGWTRSRSSAAAGAGLLDRRLGRPYGVHDRVGARGPLRVRPWIVQPEEVGHVTGQRSRL